ncbi:hypothetical protein Tco_1188665 [Tanacetum coccineum]
MYDEYFKKKSFDMSIHFAAQQDHNHEDSPSTSSIVIEEHEAPPIVSSFDEQTAPISLTKADELFQEDSAELDGNTLLTLYDALDLSEAESSIALDPSNMHEIENEAKKGVRGSDKEASRMMTWRIVVGDSEE